MLDMSRAFDTIQRGSVINHLRPILNPDELHLVSLLIKDVTLQVKCDKTLGRTFTTNIGSPQGDCASPLLFILELSKALEKSKDLIKSFSNLNTIRLTQHDHPYSKQTETVKETDKTFSIGQEYADDCSIGSTNLELIEQFNNTVPQQLEQFSLCVNKEKTERFSIKHNGDQSWKDIILLGSKLDTQSDIARRKGLASAAFNKHQNIVTNKRLPLTLRIKYFEAFVTSIFLYQSGIWTLNEKLNNKIDVFQRLFLKRIVGIRYPKTITNKELYKLTKQQPWSRTCKKRRLTLFGHTCRLPVNAPAREAIQEAIKPVKRPVGGQRTTLIKKNTQRPGMYRNLNRRRNETEQRGLSNTC